MPGVFVRMIIFEESHGETWTIRKDLALRIAGTRPENYYYGHLSELFSEELGLGSSAMVSWNAETIRNSELVIIVHPARSSVEPNVGGEPIFSDAEIACLVEYVRNGGGLLIVGEYNIDMWESNVNDVVRPLGLQFNNDSIARPRPDLESVQTRHFPIIVSSQHAICNDVFEITYHRGCSLSLAESDDSDAAPCTVISTPEGACVCAASTVGKGRVVAIGDSDLFSLAYIGQSDNVRLLLNIASWLLQRPNKDVEKGKIAVLQRGSGEWDFPKGRDLREIPGNHLFGLEIDKPAFDRAIGGLPNPYEAREEFLRECEFRFHTLPEQFRRAVIDFKRNGNGFGILHIMGLPLDPVLPPTPGNKIPPREKATFWSESWLGMIGQALGDPIGYSVHHDGEIFQNVCPIAAEEREPSAGSSKIFLEWHTEQVFHPELPDFVVLLCLRSDHEQSAMTAVASVANVLAHVPISLRQILFQPRYRAGIDYSFGATGQSQRAIGGPKVPLLYGGGYDPFMKFDLEQTQPIDRDAARAFALVKETVKKVYNYVRLNPGEMLIIDNRRSIHARSIFNPRYDGTDRWLQRIYARRDVASMDEERYRNERIIDTTFSFA